MLPADREDSATPPLLDLLDTWSFPPVPTIALIASIVLYAVGIGRLRKQGRHWPIGRSIAFGLGLASYAVISLGFLGSYSEELRWAFSTRVALLLFVVPTIVALGRPVGLAQASLGQKGRKRLDAVLASAPVRLFGNPVFAPLFALAVFLVFLTPIAGTARTNPVIDAALSLAVPLAGLLLALPLVEKRRFTATHIVLIQFMLVFMELVMDAIPGILLRLNDTILDAAPRIATAVPAWFPSPIVDQHFSGDILWFIAEVADIPVLVVFFIHWTRSDRSESRSIDALSDEEIEAMTAEHLRRR